MCLCGWDGVEREARLYQYGRERKEQGPSGLVMEILGQDNSGVRTHLGMCSCL